MRHLALTAYTDILESLRAKWFLVYTGVFGGLLVLLFLFGITESRIIGITGLSRLLVTYIQLSMAILPVFVLVTTVRSVAGDREAGVFEYLLALPIGLVRLVLGQAHRALRRGLPAGDARHVRRRPVGAMRGRRFPGSCRSITRRSSWRSPGASSGSGC